MIQDENHRALIVNGYIFDGISVCIEIGMQNAGLGTVLALEHFSEKTALPAAVFVFTCILTASILVELWSRNQKTPPVPT